MIYVTGDTHGDFSRLRDDVPMQKDDTLIICGDFGIWDNSAREQNWMKFLADRDYIIVFVDGNHENYDRLDNEFEIVDFHGGKAHKINDNVYHLMRGYVFEFEGKKFFTFGGARSHDIWGGILDPADYKSDAEFNDAYIKMYLSGACFRVKGVSWWERELPSEEEMQRGREELEKVNWQVDYVITHCLPTDIQAVFSHGEFEKDILTDYLMEIAHKLKFKQWYCGHYHNEQRVMGEYQILYYWIRGIE